MRGKREVLGQWKYLGLEAVYTWSARSSGHCSKIQDAPVGCVLSIQWKSIATLVSRLPRAPTPPPPTSRRTRF